MSQAPYVAAYNGPPTERTAQDCEAEWKKGNLGTIDTLLEEQLLLAIAQRKAIVSVLDIGSGIYAKLLNALLSDSSVAPHSQRLLALYPNMVIRLVAVTDAQSNEAFGKSKAPKKKSKTANITLEHVAYTLTGRQTLCDFLSMMEIKNLNVVLATWSLAYLSPNVFREVISTVVDNLSIGGRLIASGYAEDVSGMGFKYCPDKDLLFMEVMSSNLPKDLWEQLLGGNNSLETSVTEIKEYLCKFLTSKRMSFIMKNGEREEIFEKVKHAISMEELISLADLLKDAMRSLWEYQFQKVIKPKKDRFIDQLREDQRLTVTTTMEKLLSVQKVLE